MLYLSHGPARRRLEWKPNCRGLYTMHIRVRVRERERKRERERERKRKRENEREKAEGLGSREAEKRELLDRDGDDRRVGLSCRRSHRMEWLPSPFCHLVASHHRPTVWFTLSHCVCMRIHSSGRGVHTCPTSERTRLFQLRPHWKCGFGTRVQECALLARGSFTYPRMSRSLLIFVLTQSRGN